LKANISKALSIIEGKIADIVANLKTTSEPAATSTATQPQGNPTSKETATPPASQPQSAPKQPPTGAMANEGDGVYKELSRLHDTAKSLRSALSNIELTQLLNSAGKKAGATGEGVMMYQIPYMQNGSPETARVYIKPDDDGEGNSGEGKKGRAKSLVFMLNMTNLGAVRVDVAVGDGHARGFIYVENDDVAAHARESLKELVSALEPAGYRADFVVKTAERKFLVEELETASSPAPSGLVNIRA
ncbi:MAG: flagellar hook-length control protein FliK, partial [Nitrospinae bacterium]|nr:flagellar hook-length control protein FliK [Nitrospinota bacterium]